MAVEFPDWPRKGRDQMDRKGTVKLKNDNVRKLDQDNLYHLKLSTSTHDLEKMFGDVKFVCMGGCAKRMRNFADSMKSKLKLDEKHFLDVSGSDNRFVMYKCGPVISVNHGMGIPSMTILLHELLKLMHYAKMRDPVLLRLGTSGGLGVQAGTVVVSDGAVNGMIEPFHQVAMLAKVVRRPCVFDRDLVNEIVSCGQSLTDQFPIIRGTTMSTDDFYEGQGRMDGAFCEFTGEDKREFFNKLKKANVVNIEMEASAFSAFCHHAGVKGGVICVTLVDRLRGDQITEAKSVLEKWQLRPQLLAWEFIKKRLDVA